MKFKIVYNKFIPFKGSKAMAICPFIFARNSAKELDDVAVNHESTHCVQQIEVAVLSAVIIALLVIFAHISVWWFALVPFVYFIWYGIEYGIRSAIYWNTHEGYRNISVEQEAYNNQKNFDYLKSRKLFAWVKYLG